MDLRLIGPAAPEKGLPVVPVTLASQAAIGDPRAFVEGTRSWAVRTPYNQGNGEKSRTILLWRTDGGSRNNSLTSPENAVSFLHYPWANGCDFHFAASPRIGRGRRAEVQKKRQKQMVVP